MDAIVGSHIITLDSIDSTNNFAAKMLEGIKPVNGTAILASFQEKGRGQRGAAWQSVKGMNFLCSVILYPNFLRADEQFYLSKAVAIAIQRAFHELGISNCKIKWPNDIFINESKCGGILIENSLRGDKIENSIVGIGINVNQNEFETPGATSLKNETGKTIELKDFRSLIFESLDKYYFKLGRREFKDIEKEYEELLFGKETPRLYQIGDDKRKCLFSHVDRNGQAYLQSEDGLLGPFSIREIRLIQD